MSITIIDREVAQAHLEKWIEELRTTNHPQGGSQMISYLNGDDGDEGDEPRYCCLAVAEEIRDPYSGHLSSDALPSTGLYEWLGEPESLNGDPVSGFDPVVDWPADLWPRTWENEGKISASILNDSFKLTFAQIADVVAYFALSYPEGE